MMKHALILLILYQCYVKAAINYAQEGDACSRADRTWYAVPDSRNQFLYCHSKHGVYVRDECATRGNMQKEFNFSLQQCILSAIPAAVVVNNIGKQNDPITTTITPKLITLGSICNKNSDCTENSFCGIVSLSEEQRQCQCRLNYIPVHDRCWPIVKINHGKCTYNEQCEFSWPNAKCNRNICRCPDSTQPIETNDGLVVCSKTDQCALGGANVQLPNSANCHKKGGCSLNGVDLNYAFDCVKGPGFSTAICCPNKAQTCAQPPMPGNGLQRQIRFYYNGETDSCATFMYRGGLLVNSNVFESRSQCELYCRSGCTRGQPKMKNGKIQRCTNNDECGGQYECHGASKEHDGTCCLGPAMICTVKGGVETSVQRSTEYDAGYPPEGASSVFYPVIRYYFSPTQRQCKAFLFQGIGGNSNQFLTMNHCDQYCAPAKCGQMSIVRNAETKEYQACSHNEPCSGDGTCREGVCCTKQKQLQCPPNTQVLYRSMDKSEVYMCNLTAACPSPYSCHLPWAAFANQQRIGDITGICCLDPNRETTDAPHQQLKTSTNHGLQSEFSSTTSKTSTAPQATTTPKSTTTTSVPTTTTAGVTEKSGTEDPVCPGMGRRPLTDNHGTPLQCHLGEESSCTTPEGDHMCTYKSLNSTIGLCCERQLSDIYQCPDGLIVTVSGSVVTNQDQSLQYPKSCSPMHLSSCGPDGHCIFDELYGSYHCCEHSKTTERPVQPKKKSELDGCPADQKSFMDPISNAVLECTPSQQNTCPPGFGCYFSQTKERYQCCGIKSVCPDNSAAMVGAQQDVVICDKNNGCPSAFYCYYQTTETGTCCSEDPVIRLCDKGKALIDPEGRALKCDRPNTACPIGYSCLTRFNLSVCCPEPNHICYQPKKTTVKCPLRREETRFHYDKATRTCNAHITNVCSMNDNSFDTALKCEKYCKTEGICSHGSPLKSNGEMITCSDSRACGINHECVRTPNGNYCCPQKEYYCSLPSFRGIYCSGGQPRDVWYYNAKSARCESFSFRGCAGNLNLFSTEKQCQQHCFPANCPHGQPLMTQTGNRLHTCNIDQSSSCPVGYECQPANAKINVKSVCCPSADLLCRRPADRGVPCGTPHLRYHYDSATNLCKQFLHFGCGNIESSFLEIDQCKNFCKFEAGYCPASRKVYTWPNTTMPVTCSPVFDNCPKDYSCQKKSMSLYFCCSEPVKCLSGKRPYMRSKSTAPKSCFAGPFGYFDGCPTGHSCQMATNGDHYCCPEADVTDSCPQDAFPFVHANTGRPMVCSPDFNNCPYGFECMFNKMFDQNYCCSGRTVTELPIASTTTTTTKTTTTENPSQKELITESILYVDRDFLCDDQSEPFVDPELQSVRVCNPFLQYTCPDNHDCQYNRRISRYQCCAKPNSTPKPSTSESREACPKGMQPFMHPRTHQPIVCQPGLAGFCPYASMCQYSALYWQFICCSTNNVHADIPVLQDAANKTSVQTESASVLDQVAPGNSGCHRNEQCSKVFEGAFCHDWICKCPKKMFIYKETCVTQCPPKSETRVTIEGWRCTEH